MLTAADIRERLRQVPFEPFRLRTSSGEAYEVRHPDMCMVLGPNKMLVGIPNSANKEAVVQVAQCSILHVTALEPLDGKESKARKRRKRRA